MINRYKERKERLKHVVGLLMSLHATIYDEVFEIYETIVIHDVIGILEMH